jgi:hypothetical protein
LKSGNFSLLESSGPLQACNGIALPYLLTHFDLEDVSSKSSKTPTTQPSAADCKTPITGPCQQESVTITKEAFSFFKTYNELRKKIQGVPLPAKPGISLIILQPMKILQRDLNRITFVV